MSQVVTDRFKLTFDQENYRRIINKKDLIIHCHHYNARLQNTIESAKQINGEDVIISSAEAVFADYIPSFFKSEDDIETKWEVVAGLYKYLGFGILNFSNIKTGVITSPSSHFVHGWAAGFRSRTTPVCTFTRGFLQGAIYAITGEVVHVIEEHCMSQMAKECLFTIDRSRTTPFTTFEKDRAILKPSSSKRKFCKSNIDEAKIIDALVQMPVYGNDEGVIPAFGVYLANMPADFYNLVCIRFIEEMSKLNLFNSAKQLLVYTAETCGLNTFRGIIDSPEWEGLIAPMVKKDEDKIFGVIAVSNALGWGNWHVLDLVPAKSIKLESLNGYESVGFREFRGVANEARCFMFTGVAAGVMELIYGTGDFEERFGTYATKETSCICYSKESCDFEVEKVA
jgi:hypothetical protein